MDSLLGAEGKLSAIVVGYLLSPGEAFVYARMLPDNTILRRLSELVTPRLCIALISKIGWAEGLEYLFAEGLIPVDKTLFDIIKWAAPGGHVATMMLAKKYIELSNRKMRPEIGHDVLRSAAAGGHCDAMKLAKSWGASGFNLAFGLAAKGGHCSAMILAKELGATDFKGAASWAAEGGHIVTMELALKCVKESGKRVSDYELDEILCYAARGGHIPAMKRAKKYIELSGGAGSSRYALNRVLTHAAEEGRIAAMTLAKSWGAIDFHGAAVRADRRGHRDAVKLLESWMV